MIEGNKRDPILDLTKGDAVETYLWSWYVIKQVAGTTIVTKNGPNAESRNSLGCWAMYANNCYISHSDDDGILDMSHIAES